MPIRSDKRKIPDKAFTHAGPFHADDVFSAALLRTLNPDITIERGFAVPPEYDGLVFDIGLGEFDHHQIGNEVRDNGVPYASFGKLWQAFGDRLVGPDGVEMIDKTLIQAIDLTDNTGTPNPLSMIISSQNPSWTDEVKDYNACFEKAVRMAEGMLAGEIKRAREMELAKELANKAIEKAPCKEIVVLDTFAPVGPLLSNSSAEYFIAPSDRGGYAIQAVPKSDTDKTPKHLFPESWAGNTDLANTSNINGLTFCHTGRWFCAADTLEDALKVAIVAVAGFDRYDTEFDKVFNDVVNSLNLDQDVVHSIEEIEELTEEEIEIGDVIEVEEGVEEELEETIDVGGPAGN